MGILASGKKSKIDVTKNDYLFLNYFNKFINNTTNTFDMNSFQSDLFLNLNPNIIEFINDINNKNKSNRSKIITKETFDINEFRLVFNLLTNYDNYLSNEDDITYIYYRKNSFYIIYDFIKGKVGASQEEKLDFNTVIDIFDYIIQLYISKHNFSKPNNYNKLQILEYLTTNHITEANSAFSNFLDNTLYSLDSFLKNNFRLKFLSKSGDVILSTAPVCTEFSSILSLPQFFFFTLANSLIYPKRYAFKLYDCKVKGYNMSSIIYSFIGFPGPIAIFIEHFEKEDNKEYILGAFLNSNFKECYEKFCGDDLSFVFSIAPELKFYKFKQNSDKICFISSKPQKYSKAKSGIGLGYGYEKFKLWIDGGDLFNECYFEKYDEVFEDGTPFKELRHNLNIINIEVFGFGSKDDYESLLNKQMRDKNISDKMKKVDKAAFLEGDFNKEMFFENTFAHQSDKR